MTDDRRITVGLAPRTRPQGAATALNASERKPGAEIEDVPPTAEVEQPAPNLQRVNAKPTEKRTKNPHTTKRKPPAGKVQIAVDVPEYTRGRARAAFRFAQFYDRVPTFSEFVTNALEAEIRRIEQLHNNGNRFEPETENLAAGRPPAR